MAKQGLLGPIIGLLILMTERVLAKLPYNPSYVSHPVSENQTAVYILSPGAEGFRLQSLNISSSFDISKPPITEILGELPFTTADDEETKAFISTTDGEGILTVYSGDCQTNSSEVWRFAAEKGNPDAPFQWEKSPPKETGDTRFQVPGPTFLSSIVPYPSEGEDSPSSLFVFGGMCPIIGEGKGNWIVDAEYSQTMVSLTPDISSSSVSYQSKVVKTSSSPVAEAGFAMTPLIPAYSNTSTHSLLTHQSFVLTGGHTQQAFINMSQVALFSLPESSWSFISVGQGDTSSVTDTSDISGVEPRSGHTAILTPDGSKIIVFGGWVGDTSAPAQPQLAILEVGREYGGKGDWTWRVPQQNQHGLESGSGIFGHGATMLPGGIMFITGGYQIPEATSKREMTTLSANTQGYLFNTTSENWITSYAATRLTAAGFKESHGPLSSTSQKAGFGVGLGIGLSVVFVLLFLVCRVGSRRSREHKRAREQALRKLALGAERPHFGPAGQIHESMSEITAEKLGQSHAYSWIGNGKEGGRCDSQDNGTFNAERTGLLVEVPSPTRGLRRSMHSRSYQSAYYDDSRRHVGFNAIHPIDEGDEYEEPTEDGIMRPGQGEAQRQSRTSIISNPFSDSARFSNSHNVDPATLELSAFHEKSAGQEWMDDFDARAGGNRPLTPGKSDRTLSNLSETSGSFMSVSSQHTNPLSLNRNLARMFSFRSQQSGTAGSDSSVLYEPVRSSSPESPSRGQFHSNDRMPETMHSSDRTLVSNGSPHTPTFNQLQAESGLLLGTNSLESIRPLSLSKSKGLGWIGNVRRTLGSIRKAENVAEPYSVNPENMTTIQRSTSTSPTKSFHSVLEGRDTASESANASTNIPRRAMSTSSSILRRKQGAKDWGAKRSSADSAQILQARLAASSDSGGTGSRSSDSPHSFDYEYGDDEEWDVEAAAEGRVVQVTYTVPKEKLRVVNPGIGDDVDNDSLVASEDTNPSKSHDDDGGGGDSQQSSTDKKE
ncbi:hypothetical protein FQN52_001298 [Onygenales sp. PD_12]|nr:hypothetical protein FQN52_001298 [Onygenales sp. PD_12]